MNQSTRSEFQLWPPSRSARAAIGGLVIVSAAWMWLGSLARELLAAHMLQHLLVMNAAAPLLACAARRRFSPSRRGAWSPVGAAAAQLALLWLWHMPSAFAAAHHDQSLFAAMQVSLLAASLWFWMSILEPDAPSIWPRILALLVTAKGFCLLGAVLVFSRLGLYAHPLNPGAWGVSPLYDQQLAGLLMIGACATVYVAAAVALFARWIFASEAGAVSN